jgi:hypothetical protein
VWQDAVGGVKRASRCPSSLARYKPGPVVKFALLLVPLKARTPPPPPHPLFTLGFTLGFIFGFAIG